MKPGACRVAEGREPWGGAPVLPELEIGDHEAGIWALSADPQGRTLVTGTEDGCVAAWDVRGRACIWQVSILHPRMLWCRAEDVWLHVSGPEKERLTRTSEATLTHI